MGYIKRKNYRWIIFKFIYQENEENGNTLEQNIK